MTMTPEEIQRMKDKTAGIHLSHCYQGENEGNCKYGDDDCPAKPIAQLAKGKDCPKCNGTGYLPNDDTGEPNPPVGGIRCPLCNGTGKPDPDRTKLHEWGSPKGLPRGWRGRILKGSSDQKADPDISPYSLPSDAYDKYFTPPDPVREKVAIQIFQRFTKGTKSWERCTQKHKDIFLKVADQIQALKEEK